MPIGGGDLATTSDLGYFFLFMFSVMGGVACCCCTLGCYVRWTRRRQVRPHHHVARQRPIFVGGYEIPSDAPKLTPHEFEQLPEVVYENHNHNNNADTTNHSYFEDWVTEAIDTVTKAFDSVTNKKGNSNSSSSSSPAKATPAEGEDSGSQVAKESGTATATATATAVSDVDSDIEAPPTVESSPSRRNSSSNNNRGAAAAAESSSPSRTSINKKNTKPKKQRSPSSSSLSSLFATGKQQQSNNTSTTTTTTSTTNTTTIVNTQCSICIDEFECGEKVIVLQCHHAFHKDCIRQWLLEKQACCPLCKFELKEKSSVVVRNPDDDDPWRM